MIKGICPKCGDHVIGWSLLSANHQICSKCGVRYQITDDNHPLDKSLSTFVVETKAEEKSISKEA